MGTGWPIRTDINALRAVAVVTVVLYHFGFPGGFVGVDVFFVISGFLMTGIISRGLESGGFSLGHFYLKRAQRIIPALAVLCIILLVLGWFAFPPGDYRQLGKHVAGSMTFLSNMLYLGEAGYFDTASHSKWLLHTWSLSVEWQFYMVWPLVIMGLWRWQPRVWLAGLGLVSFLACVIISPAQPGAAFYILPTRAWEMIVGGLAYLYPLRMTARSGAWTERAGLAMIVASAMLFTPADVWPGWRAAVPVIGTAMVILAARPASRVLGHAVPQRLGAWSYSIYLWHWPVVAALSFLSLTGPLWIAAGIGLSVALGYVSWLLVEEPFRKGRWTFDLGLAVRGAGLVAPALIAGVLIYALAGAPGRVSAAVRAAEAEGMARNATHGECLLLAGVKSPECLLGSEPVKAVLVGDSHSDAVSSAAATALGGVRFLGYQNCLTIPGIQIASRHAGFRCGEYVADMFDRLGSTDGPPVIVANRTSAYIWDEFTGRAMRPLPQFEEPVGRVDAAYLADFRRRYVGGLCKLAERRTVYVMRPIPGFEGNIPREMARAALLGLPPVSKTVSLETYRERHAFALSMMDEASRRCRVRQLDPVPFLCPDGVCRPVHDGRSLYYDGTHLNEYGNRLLAPMFEAVR